MDEDDSLGVRREPVLPSMLERRAAVPRDARPTDDRPGGRHGSARRLPDARARRSGGIDSTQLTFAWFATAGTIEGGGRTVSFTAPANADTVILQVHVQDPQGNIDADSLTIVAYKQWVILKADDFRYRTDGIVSPGWWRFLEYVDARGIRAAIGLIGNEIERGDGLFHHLIRQRVGDPRIEFFNHGYDHAVSLTDSTGQVYSEFQRTPYEHQRDHLQRTQDLARERCGIVLHAFGAPGNATDSKTQRVIGESAEIRVWLFGRPPSLKLVLNHTIDIETPIFHPSYTSFVQHYDPEPVYAVYQIHPKDWSMESFREFTEIVDFLIIQGVTFTTPSAYERIVRRPIED